MAGTGVNEGLRTGAGHRRRWDVALSFAGAQRDYVQRVAVALKARGVRCFYDRDEQVRLWGTHLAEVLPQIYAKESTAVVVFISAEYVARDWTRLERRSALSRAVTEPGIYVLPARFDDSELPGLLPDVGVIDLRSLSPEEFADLVAAKLAEFGGDGQPADGKSLSWESLPQLGGDVRNLLLAETEAAQLLPYQLLGLDSPPLPLIYVRQQLLQESVRARSRDEDEVREVPGGTPSQAAIPAVDALARHEHVLLTGDPGSGKTALVQEISRRLACIWLREDSATDPPPTAPLVPLLLPARVLAEAGSFTAVLAEAARRVYGMSMLTELQPAHFAHLVKGARWLVMIDGLDEVVDQALRVKIIRAIAGHARADAPYRFIVTSRPLPVAELRPISGAPFTVFSVEPFGRAEVQEFANKWFAVQDPAGAAERSREFVREVSDSRLRQAARNPLLATIAAVAKSLDPALPLPSSRVDLYERLCGYLIGSEASGRTTRRQIYQRADEPGYRAIKWVHARREELVEWLAERYLSGDSALLQTAQAWMVHNLPEEVGEALSPAALRHLLAETGTLVVEGDGLRFSHQTIAEYLAARATARRLPASFNPDADFKVLIAQGLDPAKRTFAVFTLALWYRAGGDLGALLGALLEGPPRHSLLAGRILADCGDSRTPEGRLVVDRLMDIALSQSAIRSRGQFGDSLVRHSKRSDSDPQAASSGDAFWALGGIYGDEHVVARLRGLIASDELSVEIRTAAAVALGRSTDIDAALVVLGELADGSSAEERVQITEAIIFLDPGATDAAADVLRPVSTGNSDAATTARAAQLLAKIGFLDEAVSLGWSIVNDSNAHAAQVITAVRIILQYRAAGAVEKLLGIADGLLDKGRPALRWILVELVTSGAKEQVADFCAQALAGPKLIRWQMSIVTGAWAMAAGPAVIEQISELLDRRGARDIETLEEVALRLFEAGYPDDAFRVSMKVLQGTAKRSHLDTALWIALLTAQPDRRADVLALIDQFPASSDYAGLRLLDRLVELGENRRAADRAKSLILTDSGYSWDGISAALKVLRSAGDPTKLATELAGYIEIGSSTRHNLAIVEAVLELGDDDRAANLARAAIAKGSLSDTDMRMARILLLSEGLKTAENIVNYVRGQDRFWREGHSLKLADCLASVGALPMATRLWTELVLDASASIAVRFEACASLIQSGQRPLATTKLGEKFHTEHLPASERARIGALYSWAALCSPRNHFSIPEL